MSQKFVVGIISSICLSFLLAILTYTPTSANLLIVYIPMYIIAGIPSSLLIEKIYRNKNFSSTIKKYLMVLGLYILAGGLIGNIFFILTSMGNITKYLFLVILCIISSLVFYHISLLIGKILSYNK
ncbi:hypothetical protein V1503_04995 [Bacillus sp. SCS-151]|uniref:hypothetical protein n=1 Tax=Nanhaiella sioensis TaxID=3115293 RepID=UPI00397B8D77